MTINDNMIAIAAEKVLTGTIDDLLSGEIDNEGIRAYIATAALYIHHGEPIPPELRSWLGKLCTSNHHAV